MPRIAAMPVASAPAAAPSSSERRAPSTTCEKMSLPWSVVPNRWCHDGACRAASRLNPFGSLTEISGAISATITTNASIVRPSRDLGLPSSRTSQPGTRSCRRVRRGGAASSSSSVGSNCDIRTGTSGRAQPRVEDEVEDVHDEVGEDHADREDDEERLREGVVVSEHGLLQGVAGARVAEDVLDEDEA